jgi:acyl-CoA synthetase (AMP-forming)/AMP-acid ligase II
MTETGVDLVVPIEDAASVGTGDLGRPVPGKSIAVVDPDGVPLPDGETGELVITGAPMMLGYWGRPEATAQTLREGRLHTGDLAVRSGTGSGTWSAGRIAAAEVERCCTRTQAAAGIVARRSAAGPLVPAPAATGAATMWRSAIAFKCRAASSRSTLPHPLGRSTRRR